MSEREAVIVGGGVGALAAALALQANGWSVQAFEREAHLRAQGGALMLWPNATRALARLGVLAKVRAQAIEVQRAHVVHEGGKVFQRLPVHQLAETFCAPCLVVRRSALLEVLHGELPPDTVQFGAECTGVDLTTGVAAFANQKLEADLILGADGLNSAVRKSMFGDAQCRSAKQDAWIGMTRLREVPEGVTVGSVGRGLRSWFAAVGDGWVYWYAIVSHGRREAEGIYPKDESGEVNLRALARAFSRWHDPLPALIAAADPEQVTVVEIRDRPAVPSWQRGNVALLGDAAQPMTPDLGQGAGMALESAVALGRALAPEVPVEVGLARYAAARIPRATAVALASRFVADTSMPDDPRKCDQRDRAWELTPQAAAMLQLEMVIAPGM